MGNLGEAYYNLGTELFEVGYYEQAVEYFIQAYELGYEREQILENLYACFILPNEQEFRNNYRHNAEKIVQMPFEECALDFIPVSEKRFYIFDKEQLKFSGVFELEEKPVQGRVEEFSSILYTDTWDIREILPNMKERKWSQIYIVLNEMESKFVSFFKLPDFKELYLGNIVLFKNTELMYEFFEQNDSFYLPKKVVTTEAEKYFKLINELHMKRLHNIKHDRNNIFLSICIPSYNRGTVALKNVRHLLQCPYDSEIEIVISNNGSTEDAEGYQEIRQMEDSRIQYHEFDENQGFASNVLKTLELARGKYAVLASDEDLMILAHMGEYLTYLKANPTVGVFCEEGLGGAFFAFSQKKIFEAGFQAIDKMSNLNYMTGITYNMKLLKEVRGFDIIANMRGNIFVEYYTHIPLAFMLGKCAAFHGIKLVLWDARKSVKMNNPILKNVLPESRVAQQNGIMDFCYKGLSLSRNEFVELFFNRVQKTYFLLEIAYSVKFEKFKELDTWENICFFVYKENIKYLKDFPICLTHEEKENVKKSLQEIFFGWIDSKEVLLKYPSEDRPERKILHQIVRLEMQKFGKDVTEVEETMNHYLLQIEKQDGTEAKADEIVQDVDAFLKR